MAVCTKKSVCEMDHSNDPRLQTMELKVPEFALQFKLRDYAAEVVTLQKNCASSVAIWPPDLSKPPPAFFTWPPDLSKPPPTYSPASPEYSPTLFQPPISIPLDRVCEFKTTQADEELIFPSEQAEDDAIKLLVDDEVILLMDELLSTLDQDNVLNMQQQQPPPQQQPQEKKKKKSEKKLKRLKKKQITGQKMLQLKNEISDLLKF